MNERMDSVKEFILFFLLWRSICVLLKSLLERFKESGKIVKDFL